MRRADRAPMLINAPAELSAASSHKVHRLVAGAAPPAAIIEGIEQIGFELTHVYGLTETYGPASVCAKHEEWDALDAAARAERKARQGVPLPLQEGHDGAGSRDDGSRCRRTARRWARSCSAATSR